MVTAPILVDQFLKHGYLAVGPGLGTYYHLGSPIGAVAQVGEAVVPALRKVLDGPDEILRVHAAHALKELGPAGTGGCPVAHWHPSGGAHARIWARMGSSSMTPSRPWAGSGWRPGLPSSAESPASTRAGPVTTSWYGPWTGLALRPFRYCSMSSYRDADPYAANLPAWAWAPGHRGIS